MIKFNSLRVIFQNIKLRKVLKDGMDTFDQNFKSQVENEIIQLLIPFAEF